MVRPLIGSIGLRVPDRFARDTIAREGEAGRRWIETLPARAAHLMNRWHLTFDGPVMHGYVAIVIPVVQDDIKCVLKYSWLDTDSEHEADALLAWDGRDAVRMYDVDRVEGALLLERLDAGTTLETLAPQQAIEVAARLLRRLAIPAPAWARSLDDEAIRLCEDLPERWEAAGRPFDRSLLDTTTSILRDLIPTTTNLLVDTDLHYQNVLAGDRSPWLVIDPKVVAGDLEFGAAPLLWQEFARIRTRRDMEHRLGVLTEAAGLDEPRARGWALVRIVDYWLWAVLGKNDMDRARCEGLVRLLSSGL